MNELRKSLSLLRGTGLMLNIVIGAGLLVLPGLAVEAAGDHAFWAWLVCALVAIPLLIVFIIMGRRFPNAGGIAHFSERAFGPCAYLITSFILLGAVAFGLPSIALTGGYYLAEILPGHPAAYAAGFILAGASAHLLSAEIAARISGAAASVVLLTLFALAATGFAAIDWANIGGNFAPPAEIDLRMLFLPFMMIFFAFTGWEVAAGTAEEFRDPKRDFPRAMAISFALACSVYFAMAFVAQNVAARGAPEAVFVHVAALVFGAAGGAAIAALAAVVIAANLMGAIWAVSRLVFSLSRENWLPFKLRANQKGSPLSSVALTAAVLLLALSFDALGLLNINKMLSLAGQNFLILFGIASLALLRLSRSFWERAIAAAAVVIVAALVVMEGASVLYPVCLAGLGVGVWWGQRRQG
ncbi:MAG: amino acid permease [Gammaproteobacteria bacterium]|nr:amino acid permease [Gammaproteobacteria bacterium]